MNLEKEIFDILLQDIIPNRFQPREIFNDAELQELAESIKQHGVIQPIIVRKVGDKYEIIAGERRFRASQLAGKETIPALVRDIDDREAAKIALLENLQRSNLTPIEEAKTYQTILKIDNITQDELAANLGKSQSTIANKLRLLSLNEEVQTALLNSQISERHARSLLGLTNDQQLELLHKTINEKLTVRQLDEEVMKITGQVPTDDTKVEFPTTVQEGANMNNMMTNNVVQEQVNPIIEVQPVKNSMPQNLTEQIPNIKNNIAEDLQKESVLNPTLEKQPVDIPSIQVETPSNEVTAPLENTFENNIQINQGEPNPVNMETNESEENKVTGNIFDKLRVDREDTNLENMYELKTPDLNTVINTQSEEQSINNYNDIYDLRFAINNFRQAVQNTEKFGFKVSTTEKDIGDKYQIVIEIDKK